MTGMENMHKAGRLQTDMGWNSSAAGRVWEVLA